MTKVQLCHNSLTHLGNVVNDFDKYIQRHILWLQSSTFWEQCVHYQPQATVCAMCVCHVCACVYVPLCACVCACVYVPCVCACVCVCMCVHVYVPCVHTCGTNTSIITNQSNLGIR